MNANQNSNVSRPVPPANTGSKLLDLLADASLAFVHLERRFDPFFRPAFDAVLRDPIARFVTFLINARRVDEKLALAEEKLLPGEEQFVDSIIAIPASLTRLRQADPVLARGAGRLTFEFMVPSSRCTAARAVPAGRSRRRRAR